MTRPGFGGPPEADISAVRVRVWLSLRHGGRFYTKIPGTLVIKKFLDNGAYHSQPLRAGKINIINNLTMQSVELEKMFSLKTAYYIVFLVFFVIYRCFISRKGNNTNSPFEFCCLFVC